MKENLQKNKTVGGEHTEIALELDMKETDGVLIMQLSRLDKMICCSTFCDDQFITPYNVGQYCGGCSVHCRLFSTSGR